MNKSRLSFFQVNETTLASIVLYGDLKNSISKSSQIFTVRYIFARKRFDESLFQISPLSKLLNILFNTYIYIYIYIYI